MPLPGDTFLCVERMTRQQYEGFVVSDGRLLVHLPYGSGSCVRRYETQEILEEAGFEIIKIGIK